ncbi:hypothetical protein [Legionella sp.]|uniref:hypothetical protein n=1 Tax=Legionella sp. TaxID=459 RepID=UPI003CC1D36B
MKGILNLIVTSIFVITASTSMAASEAKTGLHSHWTCTTNASSSSAHSDKKADDEMAKNKASAASAFAFASSHCRDCTKITCEVQSK